MSIFLHRLAFFDRQKYYEKQAKEHADHRKAEEEKVESMLFRPCLYSSSESILSDARPEMLLEGPAERANRMSDLEKRRIESHRREIELAVYNDRDYSFTPNIDKVSRELGRVSSLDELHENSKGKRVKSDAVQKAEEAFSEECSFRPKINSSYPVTAPRAKSEHTDSWDSCPAVSEDETSKVKWLGDSHADKNVVGIGHVPMRINMREPEKMAQDIRLRLAEKEEKRREALAEREMLELKECTFRPKVQKHKPSIYSSPVVVRGIARHLELQNLSEQKRKEKLQQAEAAFQVKNTRKFKKTGDGNTVIEVRGPGLYSNSILLVMPRVVCRLST